eukprot:scaffold2103_cov185-Amphora_coffeaeformis.AAC.24
MGNRMPPSSLAGHFDGQSSRHGLTQSTTQQNTNKPKLLSISIIHTCGTNGAHQSLGGGRIVNEWPFVRCAPNTAW